MIFIQKNKKVSYVIKENKSYLTWILDQKDFKWFGEKGAVLKKSIQKQLGIFVDVSKVKAPQNNYNNNQNILQNYTNSKRTINDLNDIW